MSEAEVPVVKAKEEEPEEKEEQSPVKRRTSRSILQRVQSFQEGGSADLSNEAEEGSGRTERRRADTVSECEAEPRASVRELTAAFSVQSRGNWNKNEAIARRVSRKLDSRLSAVFTSDFGAADTQEKIDADHEEQQPKPVTKNRPKAYGANRHSTQPITKLEMEDLGVCQGKSIKERFASIQTASEQWRNRVPKEDSPDVARDSPPRRTLGVSPNLENRRSKLEESQVNWRERVQDKDSPRLRSTTELGNRISRLEDSQQAWKERVEEKDTLQFTVEGKIKNEGSPAVVRRNTRLVRGSPRAKSVHDKPSVDDVGDKNVGQLKPKSPMMRRIRKDTLSDEEMDDAKEKEREEAEKKKKEEEAREKEKTEKEEKEKRIVSLPSFNDPEVDLFLSPSRAVEDLLTADDDPAVEALAPEDLDACARASHRLTGVARPARPPGRRRAKGNPVRRKNERTDIFVEEFEEVRTGVTEREQRRLEVEAHASETKALALASRENFSKVTLRNVQETSPRPLSMMERLPFKPDMLLLVKGQRHVQVRLVAPHATSINSGDCFLLITADRVFAWLGRFANKIEQARVKDLGGLIVARKDLGFRGKTALVEVEEAKSQTDASKAFWATLGHRSAPSVAPTGDIDEDLWFEKCVVMTNKVFELQGDELVPVEDSWGVAPKKEMLKPDKVFVFDFGSEVYVWLGQQVSNEVRKKAMNLGQQLYDGGYDYSECHLNPVFPLQDEKDFEAIDRPEWTLFGRITQNMETLLFKAKFDDWPDTASVVKTKSLDQDTMEQDLDPDHLSFAPPSVENMIATMPPTARLELEATSVGRGGEWTEMQEGIRRKFAIMSQSVQQWMASEFEKSEVDVAQLGQFWRGGTSIVRWHYRIHVGDRRDERSNTQRNSGLGRERYAYFFWQGAESSITDKGASALITVNLDQEKGPQVQVIEGKEPAAFLRLFPVMTVHAGRPDDFKAKRSLFIVRGAIPEEGHLTEVPLSARSLRSRGCFLLLDRKEGGHHKLWLGRATPESTRAVARHLAELLREKTPPAFGISGDGLRKLQEVEEGEENAAFWRQLGSSREFKSAACTDSPASLRAWRLTSSKNRVEAGGRERLLAAEIVSPQFLRDQPSPLPILQADLHTLPQPALVLLDGGSPKLLYLWHGWWPRSKTLRVSHSSEGDSAATAAMVSEIVEEVEEVTNVRIAGSARERFARERLAALHTAAELGRIVYGDASACRCCYAGLEPDSFQEMFPSWAPNAEGAESHTKEGRAEGATEGAEKLLQQFRSQRFPLTRLQERPPPEGCDPLWLERYLEEDEFKKCFRMDRKDFDKLPMWKRNELKKEAQLF